MQLTRKRERAKSDQNAFWRKMTVPLSTYISESSLPASQFTFICRLAFPAALPLLGITGRTTELLMGMVVPLSRFVFCFVFYLRKRPCFTLEGAISLVEKHSTATRRLRGGSKCWFEITELGAARGWSNVINPVPIFSFFFYDIVRLFEVEM